MNTETKQKFMRAKEVSHYLSIGLSTVWLYAKEGKLRPIHISKRVTVFDIEEIDKLISNVEVS